MRTICGTILAAAVVAMFVAAPSAHARGILCLTFDDSHFDDWEAVMPLFEKYNARATFFARGELPPRHVAGMRRLSEAGHSIGLHGRLHVRAPVYLGEHGADAWLRDEVLPQIDICRSAGLPLRNFAYAYNARTDETDGILRGLGFARLRSGVYASPGDAGELNGAFLAAEAGEQLEMRGLGLGKSYGRGAAELLALLPRVAESNLVLSTFSHRICDNPPDNGISPQTLEEILSGAAALGIAVVGFDDLPAAKPTPFSMSFKATACLKDYGSLAYVAAADSCEADKRKADLVCDGSADAATINAVVAQMAAGRGGKIVFFPGTYVVDSWTERPWPEKRGGGKQFFGIAVPYTQTQIDFEGIGFTHKDKNTSLEMNGNGVVFKPSDRLWDAMEKDGCYSLVGGVADSNPGSSGRGYSWGFFTIKNIAFRLPDNDKAIVVVDGIWTSEMACDGVQIATGAPFNDDSRVNPKCIGIRTCAAGNNNRRYTIDHCKLMGLGTGFHVAGEHLIMRQCIAQRCGYGYVFGNVPFLERWSQQVSNHPTTMVNCSFEYTWYGITLGTSGNGNPKYVCTLNAVDLNAEESDGYDAYKAWKERKLVQDLSGGYWLGEITYHLTSKANGHIPSTRNLWGANLAEGANFRTVNLAARRRGPTADRQTSMTDLGFGYFDTDLNRMVWRTESGWSE